MKVTRISRILILLLCMLSISCSFKDMFKIKTISVNEVTLSIDEKVLPYLDLKENIELPTYTLRFSQEVNIAETKTGNYEVVFYNNDDFIISKEIANLLKEYEAKGKVSTRIIGKQNDVETWMNYTDEETGEKEKYYIKIKDNTIYNEIAYITLDNGLQLTIIYARFTDFQNTTYYRWQKTENIRIILHYPLMLHKVKDAENIDPNDPYDTENKFVILAIPNGVIYHFDTSNRKVQSMVTNEMYLEEAQYTYLYTNSFEEDYENYVKYYTEYYSGKIIENPNLNDENENEDEDNPTVSYLQYQYLGNTFNVKFSKKNFTIYLVK